jgi:peptidyl-prolyl cis-trans isomerase SurA
MKKVVFNIIILVLLVSFNLLSQTKSNDPVILTIDNQNVTKSEFLRIYHKNSTQSNPDSKSLHEYMDMFINYKLKVIEAEHLGYDTASSFVKEFNTYRDQLAKPYLYDSLAEEKLMHEAYNRLQEDRRIRQIFIKVSQYAIPEDTLKAYKKAMDLRDRLMKGEPWDSVVKLSEDGYTRKRNGVMGFITSLQIFYPVENAAYSLKMNELSMPVRSRTGYHIVQLIDIRPTRGELKVAHIMVAFPENATPAVLDSAGLKINNIYKRLLNGENFGELAKKYSDDRRSAEKGGETGWFGVGQTIPEFEITAYALKNDGDYSAPVRTSFGWHIIKRISHRPLQSYNDLKDMIKQKFERDERSRIGQLALIAKLKNEIGFKDDHGKIDLLIPLMDSSIYKAKWNSAKAMGLNTDILFKLGNTSYSVKDFAGFIGRFQRTRNQIPYKVLLDNMYKEFVNNSIVDFEKSRLEQKYPDFRYLVQEYHDGILLFNLMEEKIWTQAAKDTIGLEKYYQENKSQYKWGERVRALVVTSPDKSLVDLAYKLADDYYSGKIKEQDILNKICKTDSTKSCINVADTLFEKGDNLILDSIGWTPGISPIIFKENKFGFFIKKSKEAPGQKSLQEVKGICIADYQAYLEKIYLAELHKKYKIVVNEKLLEKM